MRNFKAPLDATWRTPGGLAGIRADLEAARARGESFSKAWAALVRPGRLHPDDVVPLRATRAAWARAYQGREADAGEAALRDIANESIAG